MNDNFERSTKRIRIDNNSDYNNNSSTSSSLNSTSSSSSSSSFLSNSSSNHNYNYNMNNSSLNLFNELRNLRQFGVLTDITLKSGNCEVRAHRCVLAASSDYFKACLTSSMKESEKNCVIELPLLDNESLIRVTDFIYGEEIEINSDNIVSTLDSADKLSLDLLKIKCCTYLSTTLTPQTCFNVYYLADRYSCIGLCNTIYSYICRHFEGASQSEEFLKLPFEEIMKYLSSDSLSVKNESIPFFAGLNWINHLKETRSCYLIDIFETVRLRFMTVQDIAQFIHPIFTKNGPYSELFQSEQGYKCLLKLMDSYRWHALPLSDTEKQLSDGNLDIPRNYARKSAIRDRLFVLGGDDGYDDHTPFHTVIVFDEILKDWIICPSFTQPRSVPGCVALVDHICIIGGYDGSRASSLVDIFNISTSSWVPGLQLKQRRCSCVCVFYQDYVYCIGGVCGPQALNSVEKISTHELLGGINGEMIVSNGWVECSSLQENRSACGAAVILHENEEFILVCGGITTGGDTVSTTERYSDLTKTWSPLAPMLSPRRSFGMCVFQGKAYAIGGNDGIHDLNTVEVYDPITNTWAYKTPMIHHRMFCSAAVVGDKIFVIGGVNNGTTLDCGECYDPVLDEWILLDPLLPTPMCGCGVVCAENVPYSFILKLESVIEEHQESNEEKVA